MFNSLILNSSLIESIYDEYTALYYSEQCVLFNQSNKKCAPILNSDMVSIDLARELRAAIGLLASASSMGSFLDNHLNLIAFILSLPNQDLTGCLMNCSNTGKCVFTKGKFECECLSSFNGPTCSTSTDLCLLNPCLNNGGCRLNDSNTPLGFVCDCVPPYYGAYCEKKRNVCLGYLKCVQHRGLCVASLGVPHCKCFQNYFGDVCQNEMPLFKRNKEIGQATAAIAIVIPMLIIVLLLIFDITNCVKNKAILVYHR